MGNALPSPFIDKEYRQIPSGVSLSERPIDIFSCHSAFGDEIITRRVAEYFFDFVRRDLVLPLQLFDEPFLPQAFDDFHGQDPNVRPFSPLVNGSSSSQIAYLTAPRFLLEAPDCRPQSHKCPSAVDWVPIKRSKMSNLQPLA
jgi:hypothetical protein